MCPFISGPWSLFVSLFVFRGRWRASQRASRCTVGRCPGVRARGAAVMDRCVDGVISSAVHPRRCVGDTIVQPGPAPGPSNGVRRATWVPLKWCSCCDECVDDVVGCAVVPPRPRPGCNCAACVPHTGAATTVAQVPRRFGSMTSSRGAITRFSDPPLCCDSLQNGPCFTLA